MQATETLLTGYTDQEKGAYLGALASLATADRQASEEEMEHLHQMAQSAGLTQTQEQAVIRSATDLSGEELAKCLDILKGSELRYSLITDLIALAKADESYSEEEKQNIEKIAQHLQVDKKQFSILDQFVDKAAERNQSPEEITKPGFLESLGMKDQFSNAGFNMPSSGRGLFGFLGPMLLGGIAAKALGGRRSGGLGGGLGGALGGLLGGSSPMGMGGGMGMGSSMGLPGGLGSLVSGLNRSRGNQSMGGLLSKLFR
jgi:uncharacterized tellurite resistance protein B-like protein